MLVEGAARVLDDTRQNILWLRKQFSPVTCDDPFVEGFAKSRGLNRWKNETSSQFRLRVVKAYAWQLLGGKNQGLAKILEYYGYKGGRIHNLRVDDPERWAEFRVDLQASAKSFTLDDFEFILFVINDQKPARSVLSGIRIQSQEESDTVWSGVGLATKRRAVMQQVAHTPAFACTGLALHSIVKTEIQVA